MNKIQREKLNDSIQALKGAAVGIGAAIDQNEELMTGEQAYQLLKLIAQQQTHLIAEDKLNGVEGVVHKIGS